MKFLTQQSAEPLLLLHGGAGPMDPSSEGVRNATHKLLHAARQVLSQVIHDPRELLVRCLEALEDEPQFNAGYGAALQADGKPRLTAAFMDGKAQTFSGVISLSDVRHPSRLALHLQSASSRVLTAPGHEVLARKLGLPAENLVTEARLAQWTKRFKDVFFQHDTVGVLVKDELSQLFAGTSTGGRGFEEPGRVSDSATVAGNYASSFAAVSATGVGEEIVDDALAARIETRVRDGQSLEEACRKTYEEGLERKRSYGWIACDHKGNWCVAHTSPAMSFVVLDFRGKILAASSGLA